MNYIITNRKEYFQKIGTYNYCSLEDMVLPNAISCDTETEGLWARRDKLFSVQIGTGKDNYIIDIETIPFNELVPYIDNKVLVFQNAVFDLGFFYQLGFFPKKVRDTFIASKLMHNGDVTMRHGFAFLMERELGLDYDKSEQKNIAKVKLSTDKAIQYCFNDVDRLLDLNEALEKKIDKGGFRETYELHCRYIRVLAYMEQCGFPISKKLWKNKCQKDKIELEEKKRIVSDYIWEHLPKYRDLQGDLFSEEKKLKLNLKSALQMIPVFKDLGINVIDEDKESINEKVISKTKHPFVDIWLAMQEVVHDVSTYGENILDRIEEDYIYTSFNPILDTARISTRKEGINILNFPANKKTRECVVAHPGAKLIVCDYTGQENSVGADFHQDAVMLASVINDADLHCAFARVLYPELKDLTDEEIIKNHKDKRTASKSPRFLFSYGGNAYTLHQNENIPMEEATIIEKAYKELHEGIYTWGDKVFQEAVKKGYIESTGGFKLQLPYFESFQKAYEKITKLDRAFWAQYREGKKQWKEKQKAELEKIPYDIKYIDSYNLYKNFYQEVRDYFKSKAKYYKLGLNNPIQATSAHQTKEAACLLFEYIEQNNHLWKAKIVNIPHDEFVLEVVDELVEEYIPIVEKCMKDGGNKYLKSGLLTMQCDAAAGISWYDAK